MNYTGYTVLKTPKSGAAFAYAKEAREFATGATGAGGYLNSAAIASGWTDVHFVSAILEGSTSLPVSIGATYPNLYTGAATVIGGATPIGDLRSEDGPYVGVGNSSVHYTKKGQEYGAAFYATYIGGTNSAPTKIGIGTTAGDITTSGYYEGSFTTRSIYEFESVYNADLDDPTKIITGSGVYKNGADVSLQFNILNRNGELLTSASQIAADPFVEKQIISILDSDSNVVFPSYRTNGDSTFTFSRSQNIDVFGSYNRNFGIRNQIVNADGGTSTGEFYLYANTATFDKVIVQSSGETSLNENLTNYSPPDTGSITSAADRADAIKYFNNQPINTSGSTGFIELTLGFNESPNFTNLGNLTIWNGTSGDFETNIENLLGNYPLNKIQQGQQIRLRADDGVAEKVPLFFKLAVDSEVAFEPELLTIGPYTLEPTVEGVDLNLYNQGEQLLVGDFTIAADGVDNSGSLNVSGEGDFARRVGIGTTSRVLRTRINTDGYSIKTAGKAVISAEDSSIHSSGSAIMGGSGHVVSGDYDVIAGGVSNNISGCDFSFIGGGSGIDIIESEYSSSIGGYNNDISGSNHSVIGGGLNNSIEGSFSNYIGGGEGNLITGANSFIGGGNANKALARYSFIGGGESNITSGEFSIIIGGVDNKTFGLQSIIAGGEENTASGDRSFIGGGNLNKANADYSYAFGHRAEIAAGNVGAAVFADGRNVSHASSGAHTATLNFQNGVYVQTDSGLYVNGNPVMTGTSPESDTLQTVTNRGATSTNAISVTNTITANQVLGTGIGNRITNNNVPYLLSGDSPAETQTLQDVTTNGNTTTTSIISTGPYISGVSGLFSGNVGIGTTSPISKLQVGDGSADDFVKVYYNDGTNLDIHGYGIEFNRTNSYLRPTTNGNKNLEIGTNSRNWNRITMYSSDDFLFNNASTELVRITQDGNVGIGTTAPNALLNVNKAAIGEYFRGGSGSTRELKISSYDTISAHAGHKFDASSANGELALAITGSTKLTILSSGNVGIGTTSPATKLNIVSTGSDSDALVVQDNVRKIKIGRDSIQVTDLSDNNTQLYLNGAGGNVSIPASGLIIGGTSPKAQLHVLSGSAASYTPDSEGDTVVIESSTAGGISLIGTGGGGAQKQKLVFGTTGDTTGAVVIYDPNNSLMSVGTTATSNFLRFTSGNGVEVMRLAANGNVGIGATNPSYKFTAYGSSTNSEIVASFGSANDQNEYTAIGLSGFIASNGATKAGLALKRTAVYGVGELHFLNNSTADNSDMTLSDSKMVILGDGNVGIGTTSPNTKLKVSGEQAPVIMLQSYRSDGLSDNYRAALVVNYNSEAFALTVGASSYKVLTTEGYTTPNITHLWSNNAKTLTLNSGNVGIGTTGPSSKLQVSGGIQMADDTDTAVAAKVGTMRYRTGTEYVEISGTELVPNGEFTTTASWGGSSSIASGRLTKTGGGLAYASNVLTNGNYYRIVVNVVSIAGTMQVYANGTNSSALAVGINSFVMQAGSANALFGFNNGYAGGVGSVIESISAVEVTAEDASYADMCMQTAASTYEWVNIVRNTY